MTTRERWIVYPLLFLTLGIVMRDKWFKSPVDAPIVTAGKIRCAQLEVGKAQCGVLTIAGAKGEDRVLLGTSSNQSGVVELRGRDGKTVFMAGADKTGRFGVVETFSSNGALRVQLSSNDEGGVVRTIARDEQIIMHLGHEAMHSGLYAILPEMGRAVRVAVAMHRQKAERKADQPKKGPPPKPLPTELPKEE